MNPTLRKHIKLGQLVKVVLKKDQSTGKLTEGVVKRVLTKSPQHPRGIKVMLEDGQVGRIQEILEMPEDEGDVWDLLRKPEPEEEEEDW